MPLPDTLLVGSVDLSTLDGVVVGSLDGLLAPGTRRGEDLTVPGLHGDIGTADLPYAAYSFDIPITVLPASPGSAEPATPVLRRAATIANLRAVAAALDTGLVTLTRRLSTAGGGYVSHTARGRFVGGLLLTWLNPEAGTAVLEFVNLDGCWYSGATVVVP